MLMKFTAPPNGPGGFAHVGGGGNSGAHPAAILCAWFYDVDQNGTSRPMLDKAEHPIPMERVLPGETLSVSVEGNLGSTPTERYLRVPRAVGMAAKPVTVALDHRTSHWMIRNSGRTNTLRVQQYGLSAVPLRPGTAMPMTGEDVAVWIPVLPREPRANDTGEAFRLLVLSAKEPVPSSGETKLITAPRRYLTPPKWEALIAYFGPHLSWPPLPAPHVRQQREVEKIAELYALEKPENWARNRHDVLAGDDGLFTAADWYPRLGGGNRTLANHLAAFYRLVELGTITLSRVRRRAVEPEFFVEPYVIIDAQLGTRP